MAFISVLSLRSLQHYTLLCCEISDISLKDSYDFTVPYLVKDLFFKAKSLNFQHNLTLICYDKGTMYSASKAYWALKSVGYENVKVLYGGLKACIDYNSEVIVYQTINPPITNILSPQLTTQIIDKKSFMNLEITNKTIIYAKILYNFLYDFSPDPSQEHLVEYLSSAGVELKTSDNIIVIGEVSSLLGMVFEVLGLKDFLVVLEDFDCTIYGFTYENEKTESAYYVSMVSESLSKASSNFEVDTGNDEDIKSHYSNRNKSIRVITEEFHDPKSCKYCMMF
ncbi:hypothetical protein SteCoe_12114 [Stentor coeruleus]|uniref:Rhodanese domain-containing protein n=1 Tax=Stentor coeruleus TaxID=5963 RepID=A0A1R2CBK9_9CILI|nr:hypothetical protein SteCoe_12114 [Stentor coeruleus]